LVELRLGLAKVGYALQARARDFLAVYFVGLSRQLLEESLEQAGDEGLPREVREGYRRVAATARGLLAWYAGVQDVSCGPLNDELAKLQRHDDFLESLQAACVVDGQPAA
jgi:hypothetical protein